MAELVANALLGLGASAGTALGAAAFIADYGLLIGSTALSVAQRNAQKRKAKAAYNAAQVDRLANVPATTAPRELVLGRVRKGGHVSFRGSVGTNKEKFVVLLSLAAHEIDAVEAIYLNDQLVTLDGSGYVQEAPYTLGKKASYTETFTGNSITLAHNPLADSVQVTRYVSGAEGGSSETVAHTLSGSTVTIGDSDGGTVTYQSEEGESKARITYHLGAAGQTADADMLTLFPTEWSTDHKGSGIAYLKAEFTYDETAFPSGMVTITAVIRGAKIYDPRTSTTAWTENPALMMRHILLHENFGRRTSLTTAEDDSIIAAANACDTTHDYGDGSVAIYRASTVIPYGTVPAEALDDLAQAMAGRWTYVAGRFVCKAGVYESPVASLGESALVGEVIDVSGSVSEVGFEVSPHRARAEKVNIITARIWDREQDYKQVALTPLRGESLIARDGAEIAQEVDMPAVFYAPQALHIAGVTMRDARDPLIITATFNWSAYHLEIYDTINLTVERYFGASPKTFLILDRVNNLNGTFTLTMKETAAAIYQPDAEFDPQGYAENTTNPAPWDIDAPTIDAVVDSPATLSDGSLVSNVVVTLDATTDAAVLNGETEIQWAQPGNAWQSVTIPGSQTQTVIAGLPDNVVIIIKARYRTQSAISDWSTHYTHTVAVAGQVPANYDSFIVSLLADNTRVFTFEYTTTTPPVDLAGVMIRFKKGATGTETWDDLVPLNSAPVLDSPREVRAGDPDDYRFAARAITRSGVLCDVADTIYQNITLPAIIGSNAELLTIAQSAMTMSFDSAGDPYPAAETVTFDAILTNLSGTVTWSAEAFNEVGTSQGAVTLGGSGNQATLTSANFLADPDTQFVVVTATLGSHTAYARVVKLTDGGEPILSVLLPQTIVVPASSDGTVSSWANATSQWYVYVGQNPVTSGVTYSLAPSGNPEGLTYTLNSSTGAIAITGAGSWADDEAIITFRATHDATGLYRDLPLKITKAKDGASAPLLQLTATGNTMSFDSSGNPYPASETITFDAILTNVSGTPTWNAEAFNELGVSQGAVSLTGSGLTRTMSSAQFLSDPDTQFVTVWVTLGSLTAVQRVVKLTDGGEPIITLLQPQEIVLPASPEGVVSSWSTASSQFWVTVGQTPVTSGVTYTLAPSGNPSSLTYTLGSTTGAITITGAGSWANTSDQTSITFRATHDATGAYRDLAMKLTKARTGIASISYEFSNPAHTVPASVAGVVSDYTGSGTTIRFLEGSTYLTYHSTTLAASRFTIGTPTISPAGGITVNTITGSGTTTATIPNHSGMSNSVDVVTITYPITVRRASGTDVTFSLVQTITKAKTGATGATGSTGATGTRGSRTLYDTSASYTSTYNNGAGAGLPSYRAQATTLIAAATSGLTPTTPIKGDSVTFTNGSNYVITLVHDGSNWNTQTTVIDGSLLVNGTVAADKLTSGTYTMTSGTGYLALGSSGFLLQAVRPNSGSLNTNPLVYIYDQYASGSTGTALKVISSYGKVFEGSVSSSNATNAPFEFIDGFTLTTGEFVKIRSYRAGLFVQNSFYTTDFKAATPTKGFISNGGGQVYGGLDVTTGNLLVTTGSATVAGAFACNGKTASTAIAVDAAVDGTSLLATSALVNDLRYVLIQFGLAV